MPAPAAPPDIPAPEIPLPQQSAPSLPDVASQDPVVVPEAAPPAPSSDARLVAATDPETPVSPLLVATASGLIGAVAALNLSMLRRGRRAARER